MAGRTVAEVGKGTCWSAGSRSTCAARRLGGETSLRRADPLGQPETGRRYVPAGRRWIFPHPGGGRSWIPGAVNPETKMLYVPAVETCMNLVPTPPGGRGFLSTGVSVNVPQKQQEEYARYCTLGRAGTPEEGPDVLLVRDELSLVDLLGGGHPGRVSVRGAGGGRRPSGCGRRRRPAAAHPRPSASTASAPPAIARICWLWRLLLNLRSFVFEEDPGKRVRR